MTLGSGQFAHDDVSLARFPTQCKLVTTEQIRRFELLRLAFFVLKSRRFEQSLKDGETITEPEKLQANLLHHIIFQQVLTLTKLDARDEALRLINTCRR